ncbi:MAG: hypothetical protein GF401_00410 [Chitinivibrionales bacterium]|nr:hypothetical protein [Chitinivibrionales bacterium]
MKLSRFFPLLLGAVFVASAQPPMQGYGADRENVGLYGGRVTGYAFDSKHGVLFATVEGALSMFSSVDSGITWAQSFPNDSLKYMDEPPDSCKPPEPDPNEPPPDPSQPPTWQPPQGCPLMDERGWAGSSYQVVSDNGVSVAITATAAVISTDGENWRTLVDHAIDGYLADTIFAQTGKRISVGLANCAAVANGFVYLGINSQVIVSPDSGQHWMPVFFPDSSYQDYQSNNRPNIRYIAPVPGDSTGMQFYVVVTDSTDASQQTLQVYKTEDGKSFTEIVVMDGTEKATGFDELFVNKLGPDTLFVTETGENKRFYRSFDGGQTWEKISSEGAPGESPRDMLVVLQDDSLPGPDHIRLLSCIFYSDDLGSTWEQMWLPGEGTVDNVMFCIPNTNTYFGFRYDGPNISTTGVSGPYSLSFEGMSAVSVYQIAQDPNNFDRVYLATASGLAVTTAYLDTTIEPAEKWADPHGAYPLLEGGRAVAVSPYDSALILYGGGNGLYRSVNGGMDESSWTQLPYDQISGYESGHVPGGREVMRFAFYSADSVFAAFRASGQLDRGYLFLSVDSGATWSVHPEFRQAVNTVVVGIDSATGEKAIYVGTGYTSGYLYRSFDGGVTWDSTAGPYNDGQIQNTGDPGNEPVRTISVVNGQIDTLVVGGAFKVAVSFDRGVTLNDSITSEVPGGGNGITCSAINKHHSDSIFFGMQNKILLLRLDSMHLSQYFVGIAGEGIYDLHYDDLMMASSQGCFDIKAMEGGITPILHGPALVRPEMRLGPALIMPGKTIVPYYLPGKGATKLQLFTLTGRNVATFVDGMMPAGSHKLELSHTSTGSGMLILKLRQADQVRCMKLPIAK